MKQLIVVSDMEGASGIFDRHAEELQPGSDPWMNKGRQKLTSDVLAVCEAANEYGIDEILYYDSHHAGYPEFNTMLDMLPDNVKVFDIPDRCFFWRRIRGQAVMEPFGIITVGQHSRYGEDNAYFPHTIQSPPIKKYSVNGIHIAEIGSSVLNFQGVKYIANIGCAASEIEAKELSQTVHHISVKDKSKNWEPNAAETFPLIKEKVARALDDYESIARVNIDGMCYFELELCDQYYFDKPDDFSWKGTFSESVATWESPSFEIGSELFNYVRTYIKHR